MAAKLARRDHPGGEAQDHRDQHECRGLRHGSRLPRRAALAMSCETAAHDEQDQQPDDDQLERGEHAVRVRQEAEHDQAEAEVVGLGQRVQARERVREAQQAHGSGQEEKCARPR